MSSQPLQETNTGISPVVEAKSLLSKGDAKGAFAVLREASWEGNAMACFDAGFMMIQGIGCKKNWEGGFELLEKGCEIVENMDDDCWKGDGSVTELFEPQAMDLRSMFFMMI